MPDIASIDKNFVIETNIERENIKFYDAKEAPISLFGVWHDGECYRRVPRDVAENTSEGVVSLAKATAGGRIRFITDSPYVILKVKYPSVGFMGHMPRSGSAGFDMYVNKDGRECYTKSFIPTGADVFDGVVDFSEQKERLITINFPLYNGVCEVYVGINGDYSIKRAPDYSVKLPMVSYGSSITQGGCASRPGNAYQAVISRRYDADFINLGFSGNAKGEVAMKDYIASLPMSAFLYDYDFNAPSADHLRETHKPIYEAVRQANPDIPIIMMARPYFFSEEQNERDLRNRIIKDTYNYAVENGDKNVYFISSRELFELCEDNGTVDGCHPTDFGFYSMAQAMIKILDKLFEVKG